MFGKLAPLVAFFAFATVQPALGASVTLASRSTSAIFNPPVTYPTAGTVWTVGQNLNVTWDLSNAPQNVTDTEGLILLRKSGVTTPLILQHNFSIFDGAVTIAVPLVVEGDDYSIILMGDSGNVSPDFTITGSGIAF
ncbi:hypothetical protein GSI_09581 [Ganoderma sinense ZZ0214-1]|uniref:Yeast cell wall synthesis Kre9/Knh1-like N-terminal domain-containing protein n=1 Tax=Ganoderma sinense ZZ0214-1 TaxID=1077348 RepID=A0A2G8S3D3_9APHY|nr:hypothetical protein GSI_09581 [Ganoderma sinense ZZ0214-1]